MPFITVKYGDNQNKIFNPQCSSQVLLECIRKHCSTGEGVTVDLTDSSGNIKHLNENLKSYANSYLEGRETYWLIKIEKGKSESEPTKYSLLLSDPEKMCPELSSRLQDLSRPKSSKGRNTGSWTNVKKKVGKTAKIVAASGRSSRGSGSSKGKR